MKEVIKVMREDMTFKHRKYTVQRFGRWAKIYDYEKYFLFPLRKKAAEFLGRTPKRRILDVATGTGAQAYELARLGHKVEGVDFSPEMLKQANKKCNSSLELTFHRADATELPFEDDSFDATSISFGLHDMPYEIGIMALEEMKRVTKNGGEILVVEYMEPKRHLLARFAQPLIGLYETKNYPSFVKNGLNKYFKAVGLRPEKTTSFLGLVQIVLGKNRK